ncbi:zona pellucida-like domain-containing protein 1 [Cololabis saira]|uniref:zona pellucida-like domain-containing protein 1 n=1 Tax=Cololabis saira TaxID=129043 RepID=UPI002AD1E26A|nr:zona pellucida-like domain-containing protein 1 [Cololabis saira]
MKTMRLIILVCQLGLFLWADAQIPTDCANSNTTRDPENSDITVICGTQHMDLSMYICPVYHALYNESLMVLNGQVDKPGCYGTADWSVTPPVLKFRFPINESSLIDCGNTYTIANQLGSGQFQDYSNVQYVNISGTVTSIDPSAGTITYRRQILYKFSCNYPMQYLLNNTKLGVSGVNIAIRDNNGSFISTLSMQLYEDSKYENILTIPETGLNLKTKIYVEVEATNLTNRFNLLLDRCYATTNPFPTQATFYDLFVGCTVDAQTKVELNGASQKAHFSFEAFRFVEHKNKTISTFYLHCATRLCEASKCSSLLPDCENSQNRRKREAKDVPTNATITSLPILVGRQSNGEAKPFSASQAATREKGYSTPVVAIIVCIVIIAIFIVGLTVFLGLHLRRRKSLMA